MVSFPINDTKGSMEMPPVCRGSDISHPSTGMLLEGRRKPESPQEPYIDLGQIPHMKKPKTMISQLFQTPRNWKETIS